MLRILGILIALIVAGWTSGASSQDENRCLPNGCGPDGWLGTAIPDSLLGCKFKHACDEHDRCYSRCLDCGDLFGADTCKGTCEQKRVRKQGCDTQFYNQILAENANAARCKLGARAYYYAVRYRGCTYFRSLRDTLRSREAIQSDIEAFLKWLEENPDQADVVSQGETLEKLSTLEPSEENRIAVEGGHLAIRSEALVKSRGKTEAQSFSERKLLNGIDVTKMTIGGAAFNLDREKQNNKSLDGKGLYQRTVP